MVHATQQTGRIIEQQQLAVDTYRLRIEAPQLAATILPGQFFMLRTPGGYDPMLGRPFALYDVIRDRQGTPFAIDLGYHVIGKMTRLMSSWTTDEPVELWGPLGNGFPPPTGKHLCCVGGGIGYTPFLAVAREALGNATFSTPTRQVAPVERVSFLYGSRSKAHRADVSEFQKISGLNVQLATDDGSEGHHGFVTDLVRDLIFHPDESERPDSLYCCGPEPMMHAVARLAESASIPCWLSLETPMACGFGACFSCVTKVVTDEDPGWDYSRTCVEGPIFNSKKLNFNRTT